MAIRGEVVGTVVAEPEHKKISEKYEVIEVPVYSDLRRKNKDTGEYENVPDSTTKIRLKLDFDNLTNWSGKLHKGDLIRIKGTFYERGYTTQDGREGRSLETSYVDSIEVVAPGKNSPAAEPKSDAPW